MRALSLVAALACVAGCKSGYDDGFAVAVTVTADKLASGDVASITALGFSVSGGDTWDNVAHPYPITNQFQKGSARWLYRPSRGASGLVDFTVLALGSGGAEIARGHAATTLKAGATVTLTIPLQAGIGGDGGVGDGGDGGGDMMPAALAVGVPCVAGRDVCASGNCVDHVCCDTKCDDPCHSCTVQGNVGTCTAVPNGVQPTHGSCPLKSPNDPVTPCSYDGTCDGHGNCRLYPKNTLCRPPSCIGNVYNPPSICDGAGACINVASYQCDPFACNTTSCFGPPCADNTVCYGANTCNQTTHSCGTLPDGRACTADSQCTNGHCVDGVCCESACSGQCQACDADLSQLGKCLPVTGAPHANNGARSPCSGNALNNCGGTCDPSSPSSPMACAYPPSTQSCVSASCTNAMYVTAQSCDGMGSCPVKAPSSCPSVMNASPACSGNGCGYVCNQYFLDCNGQAIDGCEVDSRSDNQNCGSCGNNCLTKGQTCASSVCVCPTGKKPCANTCINNTTCCTPVDCGCTMASPYTGACPGQYPYGWSCPGDECTVTNYFANPYYSNCASNCGAQLVCCPNP